MVYMAQSDGWRDHNNVNSENHSSRCWSLTVIGIRDTEKEKSKEYQGDTQFPRE